MLQNNNKTEKKKEICLKICNELLNSNKLSLTAFVFMKKN